MGLLGLAVVMTACASPEYAVKNGANFYDSFVKNSLTASPGQLNQAGPSKFLGQDHWKSPWGEGVEPGKTFNLEQIRPQPSMVLVANPVPAGNNPFMPVGYAEPRGAVGSNAGGPFGSLYGYSDNPTGVNLAFVNQDRGPAARALQPRILQGSQYALAGPVIASSFNAVLQTEYERAAQNFVDKYRSDLNGRYFRNKAMYAQQGRAVLPDDPDLWELTPENRRELWRARYALIQALEFGGRDLAPEQAAFTQVNYDCWLAEAEAVPQDILQHPCAQNFIWAFQDMRKIVAQRRAPDTLPANLYPQYAYLEQVTPPAGPPPGVGYPPSYQAPAKTIVYGDNGQNGNPNGQNGGQNGGYGQNGKGDYMQMADNMPVNPSAGINGAPDNRSQKQIDEARKKAKELILDPVRQGNKFFVYFRLGSDKLNDKSFALLNEIAEMKEEITEIKVLADGYADRSGSAQTNQKISERRVRNVIDYLIKIGLARQNIKAFAHGEYNLPHPTADGVTDARNRVVIVEVK